MNYFKNVRASIGDNLVLDPDTYCPMSRINMSVNILTEAQQDGHAWGEDEVNRRHEELADKILQEMRPLLTECVKKIGPFNYWK